MFQHTAARRRLRLAPIPRTKRICFNTQPPEGDCVFSPAGGRGKTCFNTQPPEGDCHVRFFKPVGIGFQHTAARRRLIKSGVDGTMSQVSTHSRPKATACLVACLVACMISFNTQPPEGDWYLHHLFSGFDLFQHTAARRRLRMTPFRIWLLYCFNTQPPEGDCLQPSNPASIKYGFNTQPPEGDCGVEALEGEVTWFQHTAARRRLDVAAENYGRFAVSTHSRPKATDQSTAIGSGAITVSTHSRPKATVKRRI